MTIQKLIDKVQEEKPNTFGTEKIIAFINEIESVVAEELRKRAIPYTTNDMGETLLAPAPYDRLYVSYVKSMIDYANEEYASYQLNAEQYALDFSDFADWVVRTDFVDSDNLAPRRFRNIF